MEKIVNVVLGLTVELVRVFGEPDSGNAAFDLLHEVSELLLRGIRGFGGGSWRLLLWLRRSWLTFSGLNLFRHLLDGFIDDVDDANLFVFLDEFEKVFHRFGTDIFMDMLGDFDLGLRHGFGHTLQALLTKDRFQLWLEFGGDEALVILLLANDPVVRDTKGSEHFVTNDDIRKLLGVLALFVLTDFGKQLSESDQVSLEELELTGEGGSSSEQRTNWQFWLGFGGGIG